MKKLLSLGLVLLLLVTSAPLVTFAESTLSGSVIAQSTTATVTLSGKTTGSTFVLGLSSSTTNVTSTSNEEIIEMTGLTPNTAYTLTIQETLVQVDNEVVNNPDPIVLTFTTKPMYSLTLATDGTGQGTITPSPAPTVGSYEADTMVTLTAAASAGSEFAGWSGNYGTTEVITVKMDAIKTITATFNKTANMYFSVDNEIKVFHNGTLLTPVYRPTTGSYEWQRVKHYFVQNLAIGDIVAVEGTDQGVIAGFIGEIRINGVAYPTRENSFWRQSVALQEGWNTKNFSMDATWGTVKKHANPEWNNKLIGSPTGFDADWVWLANNNYNNSANHIVYFRYVVGGFPTVTFNSDGGNEIAPVTVTAGTTFNGNAITVPVPVKTGYTFTKWVLVNSAIEFNGTYVINGNTQVIAQYTAVVPETPQPPTPQPPTPQPPTPQPPTSQPPTPEPTPQAPTEAPTVAATEVITEEAVAEGDANIFDFDSFIAESEAATEVTEATEATEVVELINEATPLADTLPQTGQLPVELFYGVGGLITAAGVFMKKRK